MSVLLSNLRLARISHEHCVNLAVVILLWYFQQT